jgi:hypothetical protein
LEGEKETHEKVKAALHMQMDVLRHQLLEAEHQTALLQQIRAIDEEKQRQCVVAAFDNQNHEIPQTDWQQQLEHDDISRIVQEKLEKLLDEHVNFASPPGAITIGSNRRLGVVGDNDDDTMMSTSTTTAVMAGSSRNRYILLAAGMTYFATVVGRLTFHRSVDMEMSHQQRHRISLPSSNNPVPAVSLTGDNDDSFSVRVVVERNEHEHKAQRMAVEMTPETPPNMPAAVLWDNMSPSLSPSMYGKQQHLSPAAAMDAIAGLLNHASFCSHYYN